MKKTAALLALILSLHAHEMDLAQLFRYYGTDKDINGYSSIYHTLFDHLRDRRIALLEIGIGTLIQGAPSSMVGYSLRNYRPGGSLRAWRDYFTNGTIHGVDVQPDTQFTDEERITTHICDSTDAEQVDLFMASLGKLEFDIIIDDGSHNDYDQYMTLENFYPYLKENGIYVIEDIYPSSPVSNNPRFLASLCNNDPYFFVGIKNNICVIFKKRLDRDAANYNY